MGLLVSKYGFGPTEEKIRALLEANCPSTPTKVRSFVGVVGFTARFIPNLATVAKPLRTISRKGIHFVRGSEQEKSFRELKKQLASVPVVAYFGKDANTQVIANASAVGLGAVLFQDKNGESRVVCYANRNLHSVERRYSQTRELFVASIG